MIYSYWQGSHPGPGFRKNLQLMLELSPFSSLWSEQGGLTSFDDDISAFYTMKFKYVWQSNASSIPWLNILEENSQEYGSITILYWRMSWWVQGQKGSLSNIFPGNQILLSLFQSVASLNVHTKILSLFVRQSFFITKQIIGEMGSTVMTSF